ncbi:MULTISPECIES: arsenate reductase ArsC [unclassified Oceanispirochaeta]|uniref:arsenate reductase ArsC n=1 Tax=unclassified Oceanispirochaeta TaxID=2635722 RepID=UPI000E08F9DC|nr:MULTISPECIES: arsenate reductase ArsC [unclassified Oceanispirochaeta]MBF9015212.1 arsenate reductase ArsC [Oceanispirochaeta sp. M2]NPD71670.1 arsenate reductase ArsC [Oceanispirochaeta sp. M1]RDG32867.1 arsenate reductase ArsC [Oceanispirochaeta sp. M1]
MKKNILFLCTGNSCRSQMAEGWMRELHSDEYNVYSAGIETHGLNPAAVKVMAEAGVDISGHKSTLATDYKEIDFDVVITVCGHADENCPVYLGRTKKIHHGFDDPPRLAKDIEDEEKKLDPFRRVRDEIRDYLKDFTL